MPRIACDMVAVYVFRRTAAGPEFLLLRRSASDDFLPGTWQPVSGGVIGNETATAAAVRELKEEAGLVPAVFYQVNTVVSFYIAARDTVYHCPSFAAEVPPAAEPVPGGEHDAFAWLRPHELTTRLMWPGQRLVVQEILDEIVRGGLATMHMRIDI